jgi:hypothetical protein
MRANAISLFVVGVLTIGCVTADGIMKRSVSRGQPNEEENATYLATYAANKEKDAALRAWALRAASRLKNQPEDAIAQLGAIVADPDEDPSIRSWAAYALGELRKSTAIPYFRKALENKIDQQTGYFVTEGLAKVLPVILENPETNDGAVNSMNTYAAHQTKFTDNMYDLFMEEATNLRVLVRGLQRVTGEEKKKADAMEVYAAVYQTFHHIAMPEMQKIYEARFTENQSSLSSAVALSFQALRKSDPSLARLLVWYTGVVAENESLAGLCSEKVVKLSEGSKDRFLRFLSTWSLSRMEVAQADAGKSLTQTTLATETDEQILRLLGSLSSTAGEPDKLQELLKVRVAAANGGK